MELAIGLSTVLKHCSPMMRLHDIDHMSPGPEGLAISIGLRIRLDDATGTQGPRSGSELEPLVLMRLVSCSRANL